VFDCLKYAVLVCLLWRVNGCFVNYIINLALIEFNENVRSLYPNLFNDTAPSVGELPFGLSMLR
jgi:hypothetical protein